MFDDKKLSRGEFLAVIGGMALTAVFFKFSSAKRIFAAVSRSKGSNTLAPSMYGNGTYGGKKA